MKINPYLALLLLSVIGLYALVLLFAPLYFYLTDYSSSANFTHHIVQWFIVYIVSAIIYNCTPLVKWLEDNLP